jgi:ketosteroid isomerase-like protein
MSVGATGPTTSPVPGPRDVALAFVKGINARSPTTLAALMTDDHEFIDSLGTSISGHEAMSTAWSGYFHLIPDYRLDVEECFCFENVVLLLGTASGTYDRDGRLRPEDRWQTPLAVRAEIRGGGVARWQVYADNEPLRQVMGRSDNSI